MKILVLGSNGLIGNAVLSVLSKKSDWIVIGSVRNKIVKTQFSCELSSRMIASGDLMHEYNLRKIVTDLEPNVVINCVGVTKHVHNLQSPIPSIIMNAILPHRLSDLSKILKFRLIHISTDCVFSGDTGDYSEGDIPDSSELYGKTKQLGEVFNENCLTIRTSTIGHEIGTSHGLLEWFLKQENCKGFRQAIFSGLPAVELARVIGEYILPDTSLNGLYHISSRSINKYDLLNIIAEVYKKKIAIIPDDSFSINRSLNGSLFNMKTGYAASDWQDLIKKMHEFELHESKIHV